MQRLLIQKQEKCRDRTITDDQIKQVCVDAINAAIQNQGLLYKKDPEDVISPEYRGMDRKIAEMKEKAVSEKNSYRHCTKGLRNATGH